MEYQNLLVRQDGPLLRIDVNRPDKLNALNQATIEELHSAFEQAGSEESVRVVILTGSGDKAFVAGADISEIRQQSPLEARSFSKRGQDLMLKIQHLGKPVIAAINGYALGGGCELAMACSLRLASDSAQIGLPEITLGIMPGFGGSQRLARLVGSGRAMHLTLTGQAIGAEQAAHIGLVNQVLPAGELYEAVDKLAGRLAKSAPHAIHGILDVINQGADLPLDAALMMETDRFALLCASQDMVEGTSAFLEKRKPEFKGH